MPRILFALTSPGRDYFSAMTRIAIASIRITNPNIQVTIACDPETEANLKSSEDPIVREADDLLVIETPDGEAGFRNRWVKTTLRLHTTGPFLFLDSDVLVRGDLSPIFETQADIAGAANHSSTKHPDTQIWIEDRKVLEEMNWKIGNQVYVNGGVLFYNNSPKAFEFAADWHEKWHLAYRQNRRFRDQPALNAALHETKTDLHILNDKYNCQFLRNLQGIPNAILWHYYSSAIKYPITAFDLECQRLTKDGVLEYKQVISMIRCNHPWRSNCFIDDIAANRKIRRTDIQGWEDAILNRNYQYFLSPRRYLDLLIKILNQRRN
jgi:hypothetical protein